MSIECSGSVHKSIELAYSCKSAGLVRWGIEKANVTWLTISPGSIPGIKYFIIDIKDKIYG